MYEKNYWRVAISSYILPSFSLSLLVFTQFHNVVLPKNCRRNTFAAYGDGLNTIWNNLIMIEQDFPFWQRSTNWVNFPKGEPFWTSDWWSSIIPRSFLYLFSKISNPICGYNLTAFSGILLTSITAYLLVFRLTRNIFVGIASSFTLTFSSFLTYAIPEHVHKTFMWGLLLVLLLCLESIRSLRIHSLVVLGITSGVMSYIDGYYTVMIFVLIVSFTLVALFKLWRLKQSNSYFSLKRIWIPFLILSSFQIPNVAVVVIDPPQTFFGLRSVQSLDVYQLKLWHLFLPSPSNSYLSETFINSLENRLNGSNFTETAFYLTWTFIAFSCFTFIKVGRITVDTTGVSMVGKNRTYSKGLDSSLMILFVVIFIAVVFSFFPTFWKTFFTFVPFFRSISRFGLLLDISFVCLGAIGMQLVFLRLRLLRARLLLMLLVTTTLFLELGSPAAQNIPMKNVEFESPGGYSWIREKTPKESIIFEFSRWTPGSSHLGYGAIHERKVANPWRPNTLLVTERFYDAGEDGFACFLMEHRVDFLVGHQSFPIPIEFQNLKFLILVYQENNNLSKYLPPDIRIYKVVKNIIKKRYTCD